MSASYYALFHLLVDAAARRLVSGSDRKALRDCLGRAFDHGVMKRVARQFAERTVSPRLSPGLNGLPLQDEIVRVAAAFVDLQQHRHEADYDVGRRFTRLEVLNIVSDAERAFVDWRAVRKVALRPPSGLSASWREAGWGLADAALVDSASIMRRRSWEAAIPGS